MQGHVALVFMDLRISFSGHSPPLVEWTLGGSVSFALNVKQSWPCSSEQALTHTFIPGTCLHVH